LPRFRNVSGDALDTQVEGRWVRCRPGDVMTVPDGVLLSPALWERLDPPTTSKAARKPAKTPPEEG